MRAWLAAALFWALSVASAAAYWGHHEASAARTQCAAAELQRTVDAQLQQIHELEHARDLSQRAAQDAAALAAKTQLEKDDAAKASAKLAACLRDGTCRVRDRFTCPGTASVRSDPFAAAGDAQQAQSGLAAADVGFLDGIAREGDDAIRELNQCIDQQLADRDLLSRAHGGASWTNNQ